MQQLISKFLMVTAMLAIMVAITGIAAASGITAPGKIDLPDGGSVTENITWDYGNDADIPVTIQWRLTRLDGNPTEEIIGYDVDDFGTSGYQTVSKSHPNFSLTFNDINAIPDKSFKLSLCKSVAGQCDTTFAFQVQVPINNVPDFPKITRSVAAVIGLVFLF